MSSKKKTNPSAREGFAAKPTPMQAWETRQRIVAHEMNKPEQYVYMASLVTAVDNLMVKTDIPKNKTGYDFVLNVLNGIDSRLYETQQQLTGMDIAYERDIPTDMQDEANGLADMLNEMLPDMLAGNLGDDKADAEAKAYLLSTFALKHAAKDPMLTDDKRDDFRVGYSETLMGPHADAIKLMAGRVWRTMQAMRPGYKGEEWTEYDTLFDVQRIYAHDAIDILKRAHTLQQGIAATPDKKPE